MRGCHGTKIHCELSPDHCLLTRIMNLITEAQPIYRLTAFFEGTDVDDLFGPDVQPANLLYPRVYAISDKLVDT